MRTFHGRIGFHQNGQVAATFYQAEDGFDFLDSAGHRQEDFVGAGTNGFLDLARSVVVNAIDAAGDARRFIPVRGEDRPWCRG